MIHDEKGNFSSAAQEFCNSIGLEIRECFEKGDRCGLTPDDILLLIFQEAETMSFKKWRELRH